MHTATREPSGAYPAPPPRSMCRLRCEGGMPAHLLASPYRIAHPDGAEWQQPRPASAPPRPPRRRAPEAWRGPASDAARMAASRGRRRRARRLRPLEAGSNDEYCKRRIASLPSCARYGPGAHLIGAPRRWRSGAPRLCGAALLACKTGSRRLAVSPPAVAGARGACATRGPPHHGLAVPAGCQACGRRGGGVRLREVVAPFRTPETNEQPRSVHAAWCSPPAWRSHTAAAAASAPARGGANGRCAPSLLCPPA